LGAHRAARAQHAVRLVQCRHGGPRYRDLTTVLDPTVLPMAEGARLDARRWDIEVAFNVSKTPLGRHLLGGPKPVMGLPQGWAVLIIAQVLHALRGARAGRAGVDPDAVARPVLVKYRPSIAARGQDPVALLVERGATMRVIRPSSRPRIGAPETPPDAITPRPPGVALERSPRYAERTCGPRSRSVA
jgi:hypothetical protein